MSACLGSGVGTGRRLLRAAKLLLQGFYPSLACRLGVHRLGLEALELHLCFFEAGFGSCDRSLLGGERSCSLSRAAREGRRLRCADTGS